MAHICRIVSNSTVRPPASDDDEEFFRRIELIPCDMIQFHFGQMQRGLIFSKPIGYHEEEEEFDVIEHLKATLSRTLAIFYPLTGRLAMVKNGDDTTSFFVDCNGAGAMFVHAVADGVSIANVLEPVKVPSDIVPSFFPMNEVLNYEGISNPLLGLQVTELLDGIFIACTMNHVVVDGTSLWHFFNTWSEISHASINRNHLQVSEFPPVFYRHQYFDGIMDLPIRIPNVSPANKILGRLRVDLQQRIFHFSKEKIAQLKAKANAEMSTNRISSLQALFAHFWVTITRSRRLNSEEEVIFALTIGLRHRIEPPLPEHYFGNAVLARLLKFTAGQLLDCGLGWAAWQLNKIVASQTGEEINKFLRKWAENPSLENPGGLPSNMLITGGSMRFNIYGNDFGWGKPLGIRCTGSGFDGRLIVFPGVEQGSIGVEVCLYPQTLQGMLDDAEFMNTVANPDSSLNV